jgi:hypothetical protein
MGPVGRDEQRSTIPDEPIHAAGHLTQQVRLAEHHNQRALGASMALNPRRVAV